MVKGGLFAPSFLLSPICSRCASSCMTYTRRELVAVRDDEIVLFMYYELTLSAVPKREREREKERFFVTRTIVKKERMGADSMTGLFSLSFSRLTGRREYI